MVFEEAMKMRMTDLELWEVPTFIVNIWEKNYSPYLLPVQEKAVKEFRILDYKHHKHNIREGSEGEINWGIGFPYHYEKVSQSRHLLVVAPTTSGKTFIGEMAAVIQALHHHRVIYLVPLRSLAEEKYNHFRTLYSSPECKLKIRVSSRDRREDDLKIIKKDFHLAIMVYEKFHYFLLKYPHLFDDLSLLIIDELQMINDPSRGPLLERIIEVIRRKNLPLRIIGLSAYLENLASFLHWFPAFHLLFDKRPVELRKGVIRQGTFRYLTHNQEEYGEEVIFNLNKREGEEISYSECLIRTVSRFIQQNEPTLLFFPTRQETRRWAYLLAENLEQRYITRATTAISELSRMEETRSRQELLFLLEKGIAYHNADLSWEERNLVEDYLSQGEIKVVCATTTLSLGVNLPFKNVILSLEKFISEDGEGNHSYGYRTRLSQADVENMGGRAGRLINYINPDQKEFGRLIFLADSPFAEKVIENLYFEKTARAIKGGVFLLQEETKAELYSPISPTYSADNQHHKLAHLLRPQKKEQDFSTFLLGAIVSGENTKERLLSYLKRVTTSFPPSSSPSNYWRFDFDFDWEKVDLIQEVEKTLTKLQKANLLTSDLSPTKEGLLICTQGMSIFTYLFFKKYLTEKSGRFSDLEVLTLLALSKEGREFFLPFPPSHYRLNKLNKLKLGNPYQERMRQLIFSSSAEEGEKEIYHQLLGKKKENTSQENTPVNGDFDLVVDFNFNFESTRLTRLTSEEEKENHLTIQKILLLYDWISEKELKEIEETYQLYGGAIRKAGEFFSWLADHLAAQAEEIMDWNKQEDKKEDLLRLKILAERLSEGVEEKGLKLARLRLPGLSRSYIRILLKEGYDDEKCLEQLTEEELSKLIPPRLARRIKERFPLKSKEDKNKALSLSDEKTKDKGPSTITAPSSPLLQIDKRRPDIITFQGKKIEVTATEFSLIYLLACHPEQVLSYEELLNELWKDDEEAIYNRISFHLSRIRRKILQNLDKDKKIDLERLKYIFAVISGRGVMLRLTAKEIKIN